MISNSSTDQSVLTQSASIKHLFHFELHAIKQLLDTACGFRFPNISTVYLTKMENIEN